MWAIREKQKQINTIKWKSSIWTKYMKFELKKTKMNCCKVKLTSSACTSQRNIQCKSYAWQRIKEQMNETK